MFHSAENGIHTAVDTAGNIPWADFEKIIPYTDLFLYDIKAMNDEIHKEYTGVSNSLILENLAKLLALKSAVWVRVPVISGVNDTKMEMEKIKSYFETNGYPEKVELLPYHAMGEHKYAALNRKSENSVVPDKGKITNSLKTFSFASPVNPAVKPVATDFTTNSFNTSETLMPFPPK